VNQVGQFPILRSLPVEAHPLRVAFQLMPCGLSIPIPLLPIRLQSISLGWINASRSISTPLASTQRHRLRGRACQRSSNSTMNSSIPS